MKLPTAIQRYRLIAEALVFVSPWIRVLLIGGFCLALVFSVLHIVTGVMPFAAIAGIGDVAMVIGLAVSAFGLPSQLIAINSSRQIGSLPGMRQACLVVLMLFCLLLPTAWVGTLLFFGKTADFIAVFFTALLSMSVVVTVGIVSAVQLPMGQMVIPLCILLSPKWTGVLLTLTVLQYLAMLVLCWGAFIIWWQRWRPQKFAISYFGVAQHNTRKWQLERIASAGDKGVQKWVQLVLAGVAFGGGAIHSAVGTILLGYSDGWQQLRRKAMSTLALLSLIVVSCFLIESFTAALQYLSILVFYFYFLVAVDLLGRFSLNMHFAWLQCMGNRDALLRQIERTYLRMLGFMGVAIMAFHLVASLILHQLPHAWMFTIMLFAYFSGQAMVMLYTSLLIYVRYGVSPLRSMLTQLLLAIVNFGFLLHAFSFWVAQPWLATAWMLAYLAVLAGAGILLRRLTQSRWQQVNFQREQG